MTDKVLIDRELLEDLRLCALGYSGVVGLSSLADEILQVVAKTDAAIKASQHQRIVDGLKAEVERLTTACNKYSEAELLAQKVVLPERMNVPMPIWRDVRMPYGTPLNEVENCNCNWLHACRAKVEQLEWEVKGVAEWRNMYSNLKAEIAARQDQTIVLNKMFDSAVADNAKLREALENIADTDPDEGTAWFHDVANAALAATQEKPE